MRGFLAIPLFFLALAPTANAGLARCFMHGIMVPRLENKEKTTLSDMIRLHFDVSTPEDQKKCEQMMESYCVHNVKEKYYSPERLKGSFKPDIDKSEEITYTFTDSCKLEID
jgi:hypothetical protein